MQRDDDRRILVVDDDPDAILLMQKHLSDAGYQVFTASDGREALRILLSEGPLIVVTDWMMPGMDGLELCRAIRSHEAIPFAFIIIVTAHQTMEDNIVEAFEAGADDYLTKPLSKKELLARLRAARRIINLQQEVSTRTRELHHYNAKMAVTNAMLAESNEKLNQAATTDALTGLMNRRAVLERLHEYWSLSNRNLKPLACIMLDLDRFKSFNDTYGHDVGDQVLKDTANTLSRHIRKGELVSRFGGEEFLILCPEATEQEATVCAQRLRQAVESTVIRRGDLKLKVTASLGVAQRTPDMNSLEDLMRAADQAMYAAKDEGRNRVCVACEKSQDQDDDHKKEQLCEEVKVYPSVSQHEGGVVLVVDDDAEQRILCKKILDRAGYKVIEAVDGVDALLKIKTHSPDVVLMDVVMPNMDGLECTREIKNNHDIRHIPIIIASSRTDASDIVAGLEAGADEYLTKPINPRELVLRIRSMLRLKTELSDYNAFRGEQSRALELISDFAGEMAILETTREVINRTVTVLAILTCSRRVCVLMPDQDQKSLLWVHGIGTKREDQPRIRLPINQGMYGETYRTGRSNVCNGNECSNTPCNLTEDPFCMTCSGMSFPLRIPENIIGVLCISDRQDGVEYSILEQEYVHLICNIAASAIHERMTRHARDEARYSIVVALARLAEYRDCDMGKHLDRVSRFCVLLAKELQRLKKYKSVITDKFLKDLEKAVPLHDIGKVAIPDSILLKPGSLTDEEFEKMKVHTVIGAKTLRSVIERVPDVGYLNMAEDIAQSHHEWYNGTGYPDGLGGDEIPLSARMTAVADVYDAITTKRVYKEAIPHIDAVVIIANGAGQHFDPDVVEAFVACEQQFKALAEELADESFNVAHSIQEALLTNAVPINIE